MISNVPKVWILQFILCYDESWLENVGSKVLSVTDSTYGHLFAVGRFDKDVRL